MEKITSLDELDAQINLIEIKRNNEALLLKEQLKISFDSLKPIHIITNALKELTNTSNFKDEIVNTSISMATGYLSKKIAIGKTGNPIKQVLGMLLQMGVTSLVSKNVDGIKSNVITILSKLFNRKNVVK